MHVAFMNVFGDHGQALSLTKKLVITKNGSNPRQASQGGGPGKRFSCLRPEVHVGTTLAPNHPQVQNIDSCNINLGAQSLWASRQADQRPIAKSMRHRLNLGLLG